MTKPNSNNLTKMMNTDGTRMYKHHVDSFSDADYPGSAVVPVEYDVLLNSIEFANYSDQAVTLNVLGMSVDVKSYTAVELHDVKGFNTLTIDGHVGMEFLCLVSL